MNETHAPARRPYRLLFSLALASLCMLFLAACDVAMPVADSTPAPAPTKPPPTATPLPRGGNLTTVIGKDITQLKPWSPADRGQEQLVSLVYRGLTSLDARLAPQPGLAEGWNVSPDGLLITFTLRSGLAWHDGKPLTADDAAWTIQNVRELSPTTALIADFQRYIAQASAPASNTVVISLTERYAPLLAELTLPVLPSHLLRDKPLDSFDFWRTPVGSGPFQLDTRAPGESIVLKANPRYYGGAPLLGRVALVISTDVEVTKKALSDGVVLLGELPPPAAQQLAATKASADKLQFGAYPENAYYFLAFNVLEGRLFADGRLRQALYLSLDIPALVSAVTGGNGVVMASSAAPGSWADLTPPPTSAVKIDQAAALLDEAGWTVGADGIREKDGARLSGRLFVRNDDQRRLQAARIIADAGRRVGMDIQVQPADFQSVILGLYSPPYDFDMLLGSWVSGAANPDFGDYAAYDPDDFALFHSSQINQGVQDNRPALRNFIGWRDPPYDNQAQAARQIYSLDERKQAIRQTQARVADQHPYIFLWADRVTIVAAKRVTTADGPPNLDTPNYLWNIERWYLN